MNTSLRLLGGMPYPCIRGYGDNGTWYFTPWVMSQTYVEGDLEMLVERGYWRAPNGARMSTRDIYNWGSQRNMDIEAGMFQPNTGQTP